MVDPRADAVTGESNARADAVIAVIAADQHGIVARAQLLHAGVSRHLVDNRVKTGRLQAVHVGVYQVGGVVSPRAREMAAVLACGGGSVSHRSGAALREWIRPQSAAEPVDVSVPHGRRGGRRPGIRVHSGDPDDETTLIVGIPVTSPARTLLDLSRVASQRELEQALASAERAGMVQRDELVSLLDRNPRRPGGRRLRDLVERTFPPALTRSEAEERLLALIRESGLPEPEMNVILHGYEVDFYWRQARLVVEVDGYAYHGSARAFVRDRQRDSALAAKGIQVLRLSWHQIRYERDKTLVQLAQALVHVRP